MAQDPVDQARTVYEASRKPIAYTQQNNQFVS